MKENIQVQFHRIHHIIEATPAATKQSLLAGEIGMSLYYLQLYKAYEKEADAEKAIYYIEEAMAQIEELQQLALGHSYSNGLAGLLYTITLLQKEALVDVDMENEFATLDTYLFSAAMHLIKEKQTNDFLHGAMGIIYYFINRLPSKPIKAYTTQLLEAFCHTVVIEVEGTWFRNITFNTDSPDTINFGLSHGNAVFLILLIQAYEKGIQIKEIPQLVETGIQLLLHYEQSINVKQERYSLFPIYVNSKNKTDLTYSNRLAWCYGDLNIVLLLYHAARFLSKPAYAKLADAMADTILLRTDFKSTLAVDAHFCHGTSGLAQFYKHLYDLQPLDKYKKAWEYWLQETIRVLPQEIDMGLYKDKERNFLEGLVGVNLTLLSYLSEQPLNWSAALLL
jgi:lantibiotic biosynthesis protein